MSDFAVKRWLEWHYEKFVGATCISTEVRDDGQPVLLFNHPDGGVLEMEVAWDKALSKDFENNDRIES